MLRSSDRFLICLAITDKWEGGYVDHPADPGGKTNRGVTQATYDDWRKRWGLPERAVRNISNDERIRIYLEGYWDAVRADTLAAGVDLATFDAGVNSGPSRARKWLLASIGGPDAETVKRICKARLSFKQGLSIWKTFGRGWTNRVTDIEARGVAMALAAATPNDNQVKARLEKEAGKAQAVAKKQTTAGAASGSGGAAGGAGTTQLDPAAADALAGWIAGGLIVAALAVASFLIWRAHVNCQRAKAYSRVAGERRP